MRYARYFFTVLLLLLLLIANVSVEALAVDTGFSTETFPQDDIDLFLKNVNISMLTDEPKKQAIECFSVDDNGLIAIGCSDSNNKTVCLYTSEGDFQYGYRFECTGTFGIELNGNVLIIYFVRSDVALAIDSAGEIKSVLEIKNTVENNSYWNNYVFSTSRTVGNTEYTLKNDMGIFNLFASSYSQLAVTKANGEESIIYDVNSVQFFKMAVTFIAVIVFVCLVAVFHILRFIKLKRNHLLR